jgi:hypothetical protein
MYLFPVIVLLGFVGGTEHRNHKLISRHHRPQFMQKTIPNPSETLPNLDSVESTIREWTPASTKIGDGTSPNNPVLSGVPNSLGPHTSSGGSPNSVANLDSQLQALENWSNDGIAKLSSSTSDNSVRVDVLSSKLRKLEADTIRNMTSLFNSLESLGHDVASNSQQQLSSVTSDVQTVKNQINELKTNQIPQAISAANQRMDDVSKAVIALDTRLSAVETFTGVNKQQSGIQSAESTDATFQAQYLSFQFVFKSWAGRLAMGGAGLGLIAVVLSIVALAKLPATPPKSEDEEQVLLEAGGEGVDPNAYDPNADPNADPNSDPNSDPNAQYYEQATDEQQQQ